MRLEMTCGAAVALAGLALADVPARAEPIRMCDGVRGVIAKGVGCEQSRALASEARAGRQVDGWSVLGNSAGIVRLKHGTAWVMLRRVPRRSVAALLIAGLYLKHVYPPAADGSTGFGTLELCAGGLMKHREEWRHVLVGPPGTEGAISASHVVGGSWKPASVFEWHGGRTLELDSKTTGDIDSDELPILGSQHVRLELRDDGSGTLRLPQSAWPVSWTRNARCRG